MQLKLVDLHNIIYRRPNYSLQTPGSIGRMVHRTDRPDRCQLMTLLSPLREVLRQTVVQLIQVYFNVGDGKNHEHNVCDRAYTFREYDARTSR